MYLIFNDKLSVNYVSRKFYSYTNNRDNLFNITIIFLFIQTLSNICRIRTGTNLFLFHSILDMLNENAS